jgi:hypothetical protein
LRWRLGRHLRSARIIRQPGCFPGPVGAPPPDPASVAPKIDPTVATTEDTRVAVLRGKVLERNDDPIPGVTITIFNHPEYGQTLSRQMQPKQCTGLAGGKTLAAGPAVKQIADFVLAILAANCNVAMAAQVVILALLVGTETLFKPAHRLHPV